MKTIQLSAHVAADGMLHIPAPDFADQDIDVVVVLAPRGIEQPKLTQDSKDKAAMIYESIELNGRFLYFNPPLVLNPYWDESGELLIVTDDTFELHVYAQTREQLADDLTAELFFLWDEYAKESSENLTDKAQELKARLLERFWENQHAA
ncbi:MAG: hypothetical protein WCI11_03550 [Candidatus Methylumidiphilus sp.]